MKRLKTADDKINKRIQKKTDSIFRKYGKHLRKKRIIEPIKRNNSNLQTDEAITIVENSLGGRRSSHDLPLS